MDDVLLRLRAEGRRLGLVSAKRRSTVELAFAATEIGHLFDVVVGGDEAARNKPAPDPLLLALERLGESPADAVYVGDSPYDMAAAKAAGIVRDRRDLGRRPRPLGYSARPTPSSTRPEELLAAL